MWGWILIIIGIIFLIYYITNTKKKNIIKRSRIPSELEEITVKNNFGNTKNIWIYPEEITNYKKQMNIL